MILVTTMSGPLRLELSSGWDLQCGFIATHENYDGADDSNFYIATGESVQDCVDDYLESGL